MKVYRLEFFCYDVTGVMLYIHERMTHSGKDVPFYDHE